MRLGKSRRVGRFTVLMLVAAGSVESSRAWAQSPTDTDSVVAPPIKSEHVVDDGQAQAPALDTWGTNKSDELPPKVTQDAQVEAEPSKPVEKTLPENSSDARESRRPIDTQADANAHLRYTLERIEIRGNTRTRERVILRYLKFRPGDILDVDDPELTLTRYRVLGTGFFRDVQFALRKGSRRGQVILVIEVIERNTIVVNDIGIGVSSDADNKGNTRPLTAYGGIDIAETNLAGTGITLGAALAVANEQNALRVRILDPSFLGTPWMISLSILRNQAKDFFGTSSSVDWTDWNNVSSNSHNYAIVDYQRFGGSLGVGRDLSTSTQLWAYYRLETIEAKKPLQASESRGGIETPIEIDVRSGRSVLSTVRATLQHDTRDHPFLPTSGWYVATWGELALHPFGSDYDYQRFDISASHWWKIPGVPHVLRFLVFAGAETGAVPFFEQYYIGDFTDFRAPRMLGLNFE